MIDWFKANTVVILVTKTQESENMDAKITINGTTSLIKLVLVGKNDTMVISGVLAAT